MTDTVAPTRELSRVEFITLVAALMALNALAIDVMLPALPYMGEALGISHENERQFVVGAYMLGFGIAQLAFGPITDRFGRRGPLFFGLAVYLVCAFAATFAPTFGILLALRFTQGLGAAGTRVIATAVVRDKFSGREMAEVMSLTFMIFMAVPI
ncbi:MAG: MFS transporter, partial [Hyphomicrobiales bacterium]